MLQPKPRPPRRATGFSLVEILVAIGILAILLAAMFQGGAALVTGAKASQTEALLAQLRLATEEFAREFDSTRMPGAASLFRGAPPDDLRYFLEHNSSQVGIDHEDIAGCDAEYSLTAARFDPLPLFSDQRSSSGVLSSPANRGYADIRAFVLAVNLFSPKAKAILDKIDPSLRRRGEIIYDRGDGSAPIPLDFFVDAWGTPLEYYATCKCSSGPFAPRIEASNDFVHNTSGEALFVSYGPDGPEQFDPGALAVADTSLVADWLNAYDPATGATVTSAVEDRRIDHPNNNDNLYSSDTFKTRIMP